MHASQEAHGFFTPMSSSASLRKMCSNEEYVYPASPMHPNREQQQQHSSTRSSGATQSWASFESQADAFSRSMPAQRFAERRTARVGLYSDPPARQSVCLTDWQHPAAREQALPRAEHDANGHSNRWQGFTISHRSEEPPYPRSAAGTPRPALARQQPEPASYSAATSSPRYPDGFAADRDAVNAPDPVAAHVRGSGAGLACRQAMSSGGSSGALLDEVAQQRGRIWEVADRVSALKQKKHEETERMLWDARFQVTTLPPCPVHGSFRAAAPQIS